MAKRHVFALGEDTGAIRAITTKQDRIIGERISVFHKHFRLDTQRIALGDDIGPLGIIIDALARALVEFHRDHLALARWREFARLAILHRLGHEFAENGRTERGTESSPAERARIVKADIAAGNQIAGEAHKPDILGIIRRAGLAGYRKTKPADAGGCGAMVHDTPHHRDQVPGGIRVHDLAARIGEHRRMAGPESLDLAALAEARIMIVERLAIAIL